MMQHSWQVFLAAVLLGCSQRPPAAGAAATKGGPAAAQASGAPTARPLKIATWNLEWLYRKSGAGTVKRSDADYQRLARYATLLAADIVAVQEVDGQAALRRVFDDATYDYHVTSESGVQRAGFAYRASLSVTPHPDYNDLDVGGLRAGADLSINHEGRQIRMLSVHLKSGCFEQPLSTAGNDCTKLAAQLPALERWIDARAAAGEPFIVLGDFNRRMRTGEPFYTELDDADPPDADLTLVTDGRSSRCWGGEHAQLIDHIVLSRSAAPWLSPSSFVQHDYAAADAPFKSRLSDHCALSVVLTPGAQQTHGQASPDAQQTHGQASPDAAGDAEGERRIKGNIGAGGRKLYHLPECPSHDETQIDESLGERFFASEAEALAAGWRKAGNCP